MANDSPILEENQCPRCGGGIPNDVERGKYPGALSRWDNETYICSDCGTEEAMIQFANKEAPREALEEDHKRWYLTAIEQIVNAKTGEDARNVLIRLLKE